MAESFADRLRALREGQGLSQYALAKRSGISKQALSNLELSNREPTWVTVQRLALALGVDYGAFADPSITLPGSEPTRPRGRPRKAPALAKDSPQGEGQGDGGKGQKGRRKGKAAGREE